MSKSYYESNKRMWDNDSLNYNSFYIYFIVSIPTQFTNIKKVNLYKNFVEKKLFR